MHSCQSRENRARFLRLRKETRTVSAVFPFWPHLSHNFHLSVSEATDDKIACAIRLPLKSFLFRFILVLASNIQNSDSRSNVIFLFVQ